MERTSASIEAGCCLLAEPPLVIIQLQSSREETLACERCLFPLRPGTAASHSSQEFLFRILEFPFVFAFCLKQKEEGELKKAGTFPKQFVRL